MSSDRSLLFGMLALQTDLVSREQLLDALNAWILQKDTQLGEILTEQGVLDNDARRVIEALVEYQEKRHGHTRTALASVRIDPQARRALEQVADADVQASVTALPTPPREYETVLADQIPPVTDLPPAGTRVRYRRLRHHASGEVGEVFVALDEEIGREVALKELQERLADQADSRARFVREAEITGHLEHPGVVPLYGLGVYPDGRPYYAMRLVRGESMQDALSRLHRADFPRRDLGERSLALRQLLTRFIAVCNAVAYAHSRGVVHRDIEPANVVLGEYGETLVVDWGLARVLGHPDAEGAACHTPLGTAAYMPPEQARGEHDRVGPRSDLWALGALLYAILTGRPPYQGSQQEALERATRCDFPLPEQARPGLPKSLAAVCHKAMAARPEDRYSTARALAEDVERWLADEPVLAYREPMGQRVRRWVRRRRTLVTSVAVLVCAGVVGLAAVGAERRRTMAEREAAKANLELAKQAVDEVFNVAREHPLFQEPRMEEAKKLLLEKTRPFHKKLRVTPTNPQAL